MPVTPVADTPSATANLSTAESVVQNFGNLTYVPVLVKQPIIPNSDYDMDWQGWWRVGEDVPGRAVYVLIDGKDNYFYATNQDRSVETKGRWQFSPGKALVIQESERVSTTFKRWVFVDGTTSYVLRGRTWEKWEKVVDPMLP